MRPVPALAGSGLALGACLSALGLAAAGRWAGGAALAGAALAGLAQGAAVLLLRPAMGAPTAVFVRRWLSGMAVRGASAVALVVAMAVFRDRLPAPWMAAGYFGVLLPLLFVETRFLR